MYRDFYGLRDLPFELTPDTRYLFLTRLHREALATLEYGLSATKPITLLVGEAGTGKTTLVRAALESDRCRGVRCVYLNNPALTTEDFIRTLALRFELSPAAGESKAVLLEELERSLRERRDRGEITALIVDEAQSLTVGLLEEIRLLANIETPAAKLLPLVLAGQPEFGRRLEDPALRQFKQRVALRCGIAPFTVSETAAYIAARIKTAGGDSFGLFTRRAVELIHECSRGIPRTINVLCDNALVSGYALGQRPVDREVILEVARDFVLTLDDADVRPAPVARVDAGGDTLVAVEERLMNWARQREDSRELFRDVSRPTRFPVFGFGRR